MDRAVLVAVVASFAVGLAIGAQGALMGVVSKSIGALRTALLVNVAGGTLAVLVLLGLSLVSGGVLASAVARNAPAAGAAGALGIGVLTGMAFALPRLGVAAGLGGIIFGQLAAGVVIDAAGWGATRVPLSAGRLAGLALMAVALVLLLPRR